jgi:hypothetical protein
MSCWPTTKAQRVPAAMFRIGWSVKRCMLARLAKTTGLKPESSKDAPAT